jgi:hypothetical protein
VFALASGRDEDEEESGGNEDFESFARGKMQLLRLSLRRARDTPLSISLSAPVTTSTLSWSFNRDFGLVHGVLKLICRYSRTWKDLRVELEQDWAVEMFSELLVRSPGVVRGNFDHMRSLHLELAVDDGEEDLGRILETGFGHEATQMLALFCSDAHQTSPTLPSTIHSSCVQRDWSTKLARATSPGAPGTMSILTTSSFRGLS